MLASCGKAGVMVLMQWQRGWGEGAKGAAVDEDEHLLESGQRSSTVLRVVSPCLFLCWVGLGIGEETGQVRWVARRAVELETWV